MSYNVKDWHSLFGHPNEAVLKVIQKQYPQFKMSHPYQCEACIMSKLKQLPYSSTPISNSHPLELLHLDICEAKGQAYDGTISFLIIIDEHTKYCECKLLKFKVSKLINLHLYWLY